MQTKNALSNVYVYIYIYIYILKFIYLLLLFFKSYIMCAIRNRDIEYVYSTLLPMRAQRPCNSSLKH